MNRATGSCLIVLGALVVLAAARAAPASAPKLPGSVPLGAWTTDDAVSAILPAAGRIYLGGAFEDVGPPASPLLALRARTGRLDAKFPRVSGGEVYAVEPDGRGGVFLGGYFKRVGRVRCESLAHVRASGVVDARWCPHVTGTVSLLAHARGRLYFAGSFSRVRGARRFVLAAVIAKTGRLTSWRPVASRDVRIRGLATSGDTVFAVGDFRSLGGRSVHNIAALDARTGKARRWSARLDRSTCSTREPCSTPVGAVATRGRAVYIAGNFDLVRGKKRVGLAALDARTGRVLKWQANMERYLLSDVSFWRLAADGPRIYVVGLFSKIRGVRRDGLAALDSRTGSVLRWRPRLPPLADVHDVVVGTSAVAVSYEAYETETDALRVVDRRTGRRVRWTTPYLPGILGELAVSGRRVVAVSSAAVIGNHPRARLAAFDPRSGRMTAWAPRLSGQVQALAASSTTLYVGGCFSRVNGQARRSLAAFDLRTGKLLPWSPSADACVEHLALSGATVYVAGAELATVDGAPRRGVAAVDASTGGLRPWDPHPSNPTSGEDAQVLALAASGSTIYVGGRFATIGGATRANLAAIDAATGAATAWNPGIDDAVAAVEPAEGTIFVGGAFKHVGATARAGVAEIDSATGAATAFDARTTNNSLQEVLVLRLVEGILFVGGDYSARFGGKHVFGTAALDRSTGRLLAWPAAPALPGDAFAFARSGQRLYVGGKLELAGSNGFLVFPY